MKGFVKSKTMRIVAVVVIIAGGLVALYNFRVGMAIVSVGGALAAVSEVL